MLKKVLTPGWTVGQRHSFATASYALTSGKIDLGNRTDPFAPSDVLGTVRLRVSPLDPHSSVFVGIGPTPAVNTYLAGVGHEQLRNWPDGTITHQAQGGAPAAAPTTLTFWAA
jgi:hypothetical protein